MIVLAALVWLPRRAIAAVALAMIAGHNFLDGISAESWGAKAWLWRILHERGEATLGGGFEAYVLYPLIPWIGVMAAGYALGPVMQREPERRRLLYAMGAAITLGFIVLRVSDLYGDPASWTVEENWLATVLSFVNCEKYPPSLLFLMMTLGPALMLLAAFEQARGRVVQVFAMFGQVPFFFYVVHIYLIHALAVLTGFALTGAFVVTPRLGFSLPEVYLVWLTVLALLYPICRWFAGLRARGTAWWWSYL
jgi:uncharacterized membrane protein